MIDKRIDGSPVDQLRLQRLRHQFDWTPWFDQELRPVFGSPCSDEDLHQISTPISIKITEESSMELGGSTSTLPSSDHAVFLDSKLVSAATTSLSIALTIILVELCGIESTTTLENFVEFRWRNLWQSTIYRSPVKFGWEFG